ncbi:FecR family protein [Saccharicrinis sp. GN24d3]|uniref:FecR family protein n=1 Tax=Saccharicrinis sp. GN24d3 TaxID=3458416 RepID=UPI004036416D
MMKNRQNINWDLAARVYSGEASQKEVNDFEKWLEKTDHKAEWIKISESLNKVDHALLSDRVDVNQAWDSVRNKTIGQNKAGIRMLYVGYVAAAACIIVAIMLFLNPFQENVVDDSLVLAQSENLIEQIDLNDGSVIDLNRNSSIEYPKSFASGSRLVSLKGEAFFDIAADKTRPFVVNTNQIQIKVVGTSFNVKAFPDANLNEVNVSSGIVEVSSLSNPNNKVVLNAGDKAVFNAEDHSLVKKQVSSNNFMAWKTKEFEFKRDKLTQAIALIEEVYDVTIEIPVGFDVEDNVISSTFDKYTIEHIIIVLNGLYGVDFQYQEN